MDTDQTYQVTIVKYGARTTRRSEVFLNYPVYGEPDGPVDVDYFFWIARNAERTVIVDTGFSPSAGSSRKRTTLVEIPELLAEFGVDTESGPAVVITHGHWDHAGNLGQFPRSRVTMARRENDFWTGQYGGRTLFRDAVEAADLAALERVRNEGRLDLFDGVTTIAPGIEVIELGGHTPGQSVVKVATTDGNVLLASDAIHYYEEYERDMPFRIVSDLVDMYAAYDTMRAMVDRGDVRHVVAGHDPDTLSRFDPVDGKYGHLAATIGAPS